MKKKFSEIICIIDRSGSMGAIQRDAIGGFNTFLESQKKLPGNASLTFVQFDTEYEVVHENKPLADVPPLDSKTFVPRGATALLDAVGKTIKSVDERLAAASKKNLPDKVIFVILTDGEENSSKEYTLSKVNKMITDQKSMHSWEFIFLAANQDAFAEALKLGINTNDTVCFAATPQGTNKAYGSMDSMVTSYRA